MANSYRNDSGNRWGSDSIRRVDNTIIVSDLDNPAIVKDFTRQLKKAVHKLAYQDITVIVDSNGAFFPNVVVPICGIIDYYISQGIDIRIESGNRKKNTKELLRYYSPDESSINMIRPLSKIWRFSTPQEIFDIQKALIGELRKEEVFAEGVLEGIEWSINEVMDNVINHAETEAGFIMGQLHKSTKHVAFTVFDAGRGIYNSLNGSSHKVRDNASALSLCLQEGVTRDSSKGQGNGLAGLLTLIKEGNGILYFASGLDTYCYKDAEANILYNQNVPISKVNACTTVDFQIDYSKDVSIDKVLTFQGKTFTFTNLFIEGIEDYDGVLHFDVATMSEGTGTREAALRLKNQIINSLKASHSIAEINFDGIEVVASSYIDELIAKLLTELGLFQFNQRIRLKNMSLVLQKTLQKSVIQRIIEDFS